jgi:hypothetical protein
VLVTVLLGSLSSEKSEFAADLGHRKALVILTKVLSVIRVTRLARLTTYIVVIVSKAQMRVYQMTLYMKLGGREAIIQAMPHLKARLEQDPCFDVASFLPEFEHSDDLTEFLVFLAGGAPIYDGKPVRDLLAPICTCNNIYERFVDHLVAVIFNGAPATEDEADLRDLMDRLRPHVLARKPVPRARVYAVQAEAVCI